MMQDTDEHGDVARGAGTASPQARRAALAGFVGGALEYYDMFLYASASALVFSRIFFTDQDPSTALLLSFATFGVAYLARPLGGVLAGHFGDRFGRRPVLIATLLVMGIATFLIGLLPSYDAIGVVAPAALVGLRILQGLSVGGEASSSTSLTLEHAPEGRRGLYTSWMINGIWVGYILATLAFVWVASLPEEQILAWGWRVPFLASALIVIAGIVIRRTVEDPAAFTDRRAEGDVARMPVATLVRRQWRDLLRVAAASMLFVIAATVPVCGLGYATNVVGIEPSVILWATIGSYALALVTQPAFAALSDRIGRRPVLIGGNLVAIAGAWITFRAIGEADEVMIAVGMLVAMTLGFGATNAVYPAFFSEMFDVRVRVSGMAIGIQLGIVVQGMSPTLAQLLSTANGDAWWWPAAVITTVACLVSCLAVASARETASVPTAALGVR